jgi:hypothetical protein
MRSLVLALFCLSLLVGCAASSGGGGASDTARANCPRHGDGLCGIGPQGRQNKR